MVNIVLLEPEMPANTGNIGRTCVATGSRLHLIRPLGFQLTDRMIKRAGLDYWPYLDVTVYDDYQDFLRKNPGARIYMASTKSRRLYTEPSYEDGCYLLFGKESAGLPEELLLEHEADTLRIPMIGDIRSLNLANSVAVVVYEALRHQGFSGLNCRGELHRLSWDCPASSDAVLPRSAAVGSRDAWRDPFTEIPKRMRGVSSEENSLIQAADFRFSEAD